MNNLLVFDDETELGSLYADQLHDVDLVRRNFKVDFVKPDDFKKMMYALERRQEQFRPGRKKGKTDSVVLDEASLFVIDFDLFKSSDPGTYLTGENVAYLARCFSKCKLLIGLNQFGQNTFDLTLKGHPESYFDLNIGSKQLQNPGLWGGKAEGFRPWYWPNILKYLESFDKRIEDVKTNIDEPISVVLGLEKVSRMFSPTACDFLGGDPLKITFRQFVLKSGNGLKGRDDRADLEILARVAAARISKWLERLVLPGQDVLVDAAHLVSRYPSLLRGSDYSNVDSWNRTASFENVTRLGLDNKRIEDFRFQKEHWLSRPAWSWLDLTNLQKVKEVSEPWSREMTPYLFCEDSSQFHKPRYCREFIAEVDSPYNRRYIRQFANVEYRPEVRLLKQ